MMLSKLKTFQRKDLIALPRPNEKEEKMRKITAKKIWTKPALITISKNDLAKHIRAAARSNDYFCPTQIR